MTLRLFDGAWYNQIGFSMKKWALIFLPVIALVIFGYGFWSLASMPEPQDPLVILEIEEQGVQIKRPNAVNWESATSGMEVGMGWTVKTDTTGLATIRFYGQGESRLFHNTEVTITNAEYAKDQPGQVSVQMELILGRVWSRVLKLLDVNASYEVKTSAVVATVRGTAFDVSKTADDETTVTVSESAVTVLANESTEAVAVAEGRAITVDRSGAVKKNERISDELRMSDWFLKNTLADEQFIEKEKMRKIEALKRLDGPRPDSFLSGLASLSEQTHLLFASEENKESLAERYTARQFMHLIELVEIGKTGLAAQEFARLENYVRTELSGSDDDAERKRILSALKRIQFLVEDANPDDAFYPFKQRIEKLTELLVDQDIVARFYARLLSLDARLDEALRLMINQSWDDARIALDGVRNGIENVRREISEESVDFGDAERTIVQKHRALDARERVLRDRLDQMIEASQRLHTTSTEPSVLDVLPEGEEGLETGSDAEGETADPQFVSIELSIQPKQMEIGDTAQLTVWGVHEDGSKRDVTARATFTMDQAIGLLNGPTFVGQKTGIANIKAQYRDGSEWHFATDAIQVTGEVFIKELILTPMAGSVLEPGQSTRLRATIKYNDGTTKEVTDEVRFVQASGQGSLRGNIFTAMDIDGDISEIAASYAENQRTVVGTIKITTRK